MSRIAPTRLPSSQDLKLRRDGFAAGGIGVGIGLGVLMRCPSVIRMRA
jgi:hypothetical protein